MAIILIAILLLWLGIIFPWLFIIYVILVLASLIE